MSPALLLCFSLSITVALIQMLLTHLGLLISKFLNIIYLACYSHHHLLESILSVNQNLNTSLVSSFFSYLSLSWRLYRVCFLLSWWLYLTLPLIPDSSTPTSCIWQLQSDQLHLAVPPRPIFYFLCLAALLQPAVSGSSIPTNLLFFMLGVFILTNCTRWFYPDQSSTFYAWRFYADHLHLAILPQPGLFFFFFFLIPGGSIPTNYA